MSETLYALIGRDAHGKRLLVVGTPREAFTLHGKVAPSFHRFCLSLFALRPQASSIDVVRWHTGLDLETAPVVLIARRTEEQGPGWVNYEIRGTDGSSQDQTHSPDTWEVHA